jgi:hypothetical protein
MTHCQYMKVARVICLNYHLQQGCELLWGQLIISWLLYQCIDPCCPFAAIGWCCTAQGNAIKVQCVLQQRQQLCCRYTI